MPALFERIALSHLVSSPSSLSSSATYPQWSVWLKGSWLHLTETNLCSGMRGFIILGKHWLLLSTWPAFAFQNMDKNGGCTCCWEFACQNKRQHVIGGSEWCSALTSAVCRDSIEQGLPQTPEQPKLPRKGVSKENKKFPRRYGRKESYPNRTNIHIFQLTSFEHLSENFLLQGWEALLTLSQCLNTDTCLWVSDWRFLGVGGRAPECNQIFVKREKPKTPVWND